MAKRNIKRFFLGAASAAAIAVSLMHADNAHIPKPDIDLDFINRSTLDSRITYTCASAARYFDASMTMQSAAIDEPRFNHTLADGAIGWALEDAATNLALQSQTFGTTWITTRASIADNGAVAPDGTTTMDKLIEDGTGSATHVTQLNGIAFTSGTIYTASVFAKANTRSQVFLELSTSAFPNAAFTSFNLSTGSVIVEGAGANNSGIEDVGGGVFRCWVTATADATTNSAYQIFLAVGGAKTYSGDNASGLFLWGAQIEANDAPSPYIVTTTAALTRAAAVGTMPVTTIGSGHGTIYAEGQVSAVGNSLTRYFAVADDGAVTDSIRAGAISTSDKAFLQTTNSSGDNGFSDAGTITAFTTFKLAGTFVQDYVIASVGGVLDATPDTVVDIPIANTPTILRFGTDDDGNKYLNGHLAKFKHWETRLSDGNLKELTL